MNINLVYIYPKIIEINNEIHLLRIIDQKLKESLVLYCIKEDNVYKISSINTMVGEVKYLINYNDENDLRKLVNNIKSKEKNIKELNNLEKIEKYILKTIKY
ncbi:MAG TPA: hypothetical protein K8V90_00440 [Romboutsia timonensis]|uniref:Uncharacterized protein n=1 Tax=Romboutsia timonensis TaxID=1776391 RepID=A0A921SYE4_9FIRM|nr:hypothetical protein [uncultured Romboutsia sp.]HJG95559.1 hypothetical protein [Romboutsia timonensis]